MAKNIREDEIWDELLYWLEHPVTEEEQQLREEEEKAYCDALLDKVFDDKKPKGFATGGAAPVGFQENLDKNGRIFQTDMNGNRMPPSNNYLEKMGNAAKAFGTNVSSWINETNPEHQSYKQKMDVIGSLATLPLGAGATVAKTAAAKLAPYTGRKIAQSMAQGLSGGALSGAVEGGLRSYQEKKNPLKTIPQDTVIGGVAGLGFGAAGSNVQKWVKGKQLKSYGDIDKLDKLSRKQYSKDVRNYYQDYVQGIKLKKDGEIALTKRGIQEQLRWNPKQGKYLPGLVKDIKSAKRLPNEPNNDPLDKKFTDNFEVYEGKYGKHLIERFNDGSRRFYITKSTPNGTPHATSTGSNGSATNIIPDVEPKLKSFEAWLEDLKRKRGHK